MAFWINTPTFTYFPAEMHVRMPRVKSGAAADSARAGASNLLAFVECLLTSDGKEDISATPSSKLARYARIRHLVQQRDGMCGGA